jgi:hypothetical protein
MEKQPEEIMQSEVVTETVTEAETAIVTEEIAEQESSATVAQEQLEMDISDDDAQDEIQRHAEEVNTRNTLCAVDCGGGVPDYLTPDQVRAMDRQQVREHYALILESMKHWQ